MGVPLIMAGTLNIKLTSYSNFLKSDPYYDNVILQSFDKPVHEIFRIINL